MKLRRKRVSQTKAAQSFTELGMGLKYGTSLEQRFKRANRKAMVLFPKEDDILHDPLLLFGPTEHQCGSVVLTVNSLFLKRGYNPLYFSRNNILRTREMKTGNRLPLNKRAFWYEGKELDSS
jgi:hypothetical protein